MSPATPPGETRHRILEYVRRRILDGSSPTVREVQEEFGFKAVQTAREHLEKLVTEGRLRKDPGRARGYRLPTLPSRPSYIPLLGRVQAGLLTTALEEPEGYLAVPAHPSDDERFALRVQGESMIDHGILEGDLVIVRRRAEVKSGDIVVAVIGEEATVKTFRKRRGKVELHPANVNYPILTPDPSELFLLGRVVEVRRYFDEPELFPTPPSSRPSSSNDDLGEVS